MDISICVRSKGLEINVKASQSEPLVESLLRAKIEVGNSCGGNGSCGTCRIIVLSDIKALPAPNEIEREMIESRQFSPKERLSCQIFPVGNLKIEVPT